MREKVRGFLSGLVPSGGLQRSTRRVAGAEFVSSGGLQRSTRRVAGAEFVSSGGLQHSIRRQRALPEPLVQVVIPVHQESRPIERAVASVVEPGLVQAIVVAHNLSVSVFQERLAPFGADVTLIECHDGIHSPAGPLNAGLDYASAPWVTCMGSDDREQPGAARAWVAHLRERPADVVILPMLRPATGEFSIPTVRPGRTRDLDLVQDRLSYRTGPIMLVKRSMLCRYDIRMTDGLKTGEDLNWSLHAMAQATHIDLLTPGSPCYVETNDAADRVTAQPYPLIDALAPAEHLARQAWLHEQPASVRHAITVRVLRHSVLPAISRACVSSGDAPSGSLQRSTRRQAGVGFLSSGSLQRSTRQSGRCVGRVLGHGQDRALARRVIATWVQIDPDWARPMSSVENQAIRALLQPGDSWPLHRIEALTGTGTHRFGARLARVLPSSPLGIFDPEARPRHLLAKKLNQAWYTPRQRVTNAQEKSPAGPRTFHEACRSVARGAAEPQASPRTFAKARRSVVRAAAEPQASPRTFAEACRNVARGVDETQARPRPSDQGRRRCDAQTGGGR